MGPTPQDSVGGAVWGAVLSPDTGIWTGNPLLQYAGINIGPVHKKDVMKASVMLEHDPQYAVILAFDVRIERDAQEMADSLAVRIFRAEIIYHLFDAFTKYRQDYKKQKQEEFK